MDAPAAAYLERRQLPFIAPAPDRGPAQLEVLGHFSDCEDFVHGITSSIVNGRRQMGVFVTTAQDLTRENYVH